MNDNIMSKLYELCLCGEIEGIQAIRESDLQSEYEKIDIFEKQHGISATDHRKFEDDVLTEFTYASGLNGFICGFAFAVKLIMEANS